MTNSFTLLLSFLFFFCSQHSFSQISNNFEFLDHRDQVTEHREFKMFGDQLIYVADNSGNPQTTVNVVNTLTNSVDTILETFNAQTDLFEFSDGSFDIYLYALFDYDIIIPGFFHVQYDSSGFSVDTFGVEFDNESALFDIYAHSICKTQDGPYYLCDAKDLYQFDGSDLELIYQFNNSIRLFQNDNRDIFIKEQNQIIKIHNDQLDTIQIFGDGIFRIKNRGVFNDVLFRDSIQIWNDEFSQLIWTWEYDGLPFDFDKIYIGDQVLSFLVTDENNSKIISLDTFGGQSESNVEIEPNEELVAFEFESDSTILAVLNREVEQVNANQLLFRSISFNEENNYKSREVSIDSVSITLLSLDTFDIIYDMGDTIYRTSKTVDFNLAYTNHSDTSIEKLNVFTSLVWNGSDPRNLNFSVKDSLLSGESKFSFISNFTGYSTPIVMTFTIPGVDYRINDDPEFLFTADMILDVDKLFTEVDFDIYPNPTNDVINLDVDYNIEELSIYNNRGQLVMYKAGFTLLNTFDVSQLNDGIYFLRIRTDKNEVGLKKFIKQ